MIGGGGNPSHISIPGPSASKGELLETLRVLQVQMQRLQEENRSIKEENKTLHAEKPKQKWCADTQHELSAHEDIITIYARKYGMMVEMFPSGNLLNSKLPESPTLFNSPDQYMTAATQDSAFLDELYQHFPESLHKMMESSYFSDLVLKSIPDAHANKIKKLCGVAGDIFDLPSKYFTNPGFERAAIPEIQQLLGVTSATNQTYKPFLPVLFPGLKEDKSLKMVFRNWELLARILKASLCGVSSLHQGSSGGGAHTNSLKWSVCQITPGSIALAVVIDTEFSSSGLGKKSNINYKNLFYNYKKILIVKWSTRRILSIVANINCYVFKAAKGPTINSAEQEDHTDAIDRALAALDMSDSDSDDQSNLLALTSATLPVADPAAATLSTTVRNSQPEALPEATDVDLHVAEVMQDAGGSASGQGQMKTRGRKAAPAPEATSCTTCRSCK
ncbi:uncharacterized protein EDB93DRAFT_1258733 [Suillus bovinus]|uniref:uncharacterized protein n=1 Tax=Suillus bovinus TaxID=48563 RepID=UPI001B875A51|nr:uncharacterized protein EDB93DRAFT_1258733 [Suillus bovinus]KAG2124584.1 hypothetical protein EDB93DRAFT_1258733 [Suillus bovinus]